MNLTLPPGSDGHGRRRNRGIMDANFCPRCPGYTPSIGQHNPSLISGLSQRPRCPGYFLMLRFFSMLLSPFLESSAALFPRARENPRTPRTLGQVLDFTLLILS